MTSKDFKVKYTEINRDKGDKLINDKTVKFQVKGDEKKMLQGDLVETPTYIEQQNLKLNYLFYIKKQSL